MFMHRSQAIIWTLAFLASPSAVTAQTAQVAPSAAQPGVTLQIIVPPMAQPAPQTVAPLQTGLPPRVLSDILKSAYADPSQRCDPPPRSGARWNDHDGDG